MNSSVYTPVSIHRDRRKIFVERMDDRRLRKGIYKANVCENVGKARLSTKLVTSQLCTVLNLTIRILFDPEFKEYLLIFPDMVFIKDQGMVAHLYKSKRDPNSLFVTFEESMN